MSDEGEFGQLLHRLRRARDLTQESLGQAAFCSRDTIKKLETGQRRPSRQLAAQLADVLGLEEPTRAAFLAAARASRTLGEREQNKHNLSQQSAVITAPDQLPAADTESSRSRLLPAPLTPFVGRVEDLHRLTALLTEPSIRLVTLVAPGGMGKTRLALTALERLQADDAFRHGVAFAALAPVADAEHLDTTLAAALGLPLTTRGALARTPRQQLLDYLREKHLLFALDNCEHLLEDVAALATLILAEAPEVTLIATSRERLGLRAEQLLPLDGMAPEEDGAVLFAATVRAVQPAFNLTEGNRRLVAAICAQVGGMPLAIELAAGWADTLSLSEIADEVRQDGSLLATQARDVPVRHRSVRVICDATWDRLSTQEQRIFAQVAVFRDGGTRRAIQAVTEAGLGLLQALVGKALLRYDPERERYAVHELLRQYAAERLAEDRSVEAGARERHAAYYLDALAAREGQLTGAGQVQALDEIGKDIENVHTAWRWAVEAGRTDLILPASFALGLFYEWQSRYGEGLAAFTLAWERLPPLVENRMARGLALAWGGAFDYLLGEQERAQERITFALAELEQVVPGQARTEAPRAFACLQLGHITARNDFAAAEQAYIRSRELARACGDHWLIAMALAGLGTIRTEQGDFGPAETYWQEGLQISRTLGNLLGVADALAALSRIARYQGKLAENVQLAQESYDLYVRLGNRAMLAYGALYLGRALHWGGELPQAITLLSTAVASFRELGNQQGLVDALYQRGGVFLVLGRYDESEADVHAGLARASLTKDMNSTAQCHWSLAASALGRGAYDEAEREVQTAISLLEDMQQMEWVGRAYIIAADISRSRGYTSRAWGWLAAALQVGLRHHSYLTITFATRSVARLLAETGAVERAIELGELARPLMYGKWAEDLYYTQLDALATTLPPKYMAAARERGRQRDLWATAAALVMEIETAGWAEEPRP